MSHQRLCEFPRCGRRHKGRGLCESHLRLQRKGAPLRELAVVGIGVDASVRLRDYSVQVGTCRIWQRAKAGGYGRISVGKKLRPAHRVAWELERGPVPEGMVLNHICGNRACVNASHLEVVSQGENAQYRTVPMSNNTSGYRGVYFVKRYSKWKAYVRIGGKEKYIGLFDTAKEAGEAAERGRRKYHTMPEFKDHVKTLSPKGAV